MKDVIRQVKSIWDQILDRVQDLLEVAAVQQISDADLMARLENEDQNRIKAGGAKLNWKTSVIDFLTLLNIDSSAENRAALYQELNVSNEFTSGSAEGNELLRVAVFKKLKESGGNVPDDLLD